MPGMLLTYEKHLMVYETIKVTKVSVFGEISNKYPEPSI